MILRCVPPRAQRGIQIKMILILRCSRPRAQRGIKIKMILILRCSRPRAQRGIRIKDPANPALCLGLVRRADWI